MSVAEALAIPRSILDMLFHGDWDHYHSVHLEIGGSGLKRLEGYLNLDFVYCQDYVHSTHFGKEACFLQYSVSGIGGRCSRYLVCQPCVPITSFRLMSYVRRKVSKVRAVVRGPACDTGSKWTW